MFNSLLRAPRRAGLPIVLAALSATATAAQQPTPSTQQREHVVRAGDTLWDLARTYLMNAFLWPMIYEANRGVVENPHRIFPGERLLIPTLQPAEEPRPLGEPVVDSVRVAPVPQPEPQAEPMPEPGAVIASLDLRRPVVSTGEFLSTPWLAPSPQRSVVGRIIRLADPAAALDRLPSTLHPNDRVHLGALVGTRAPGDTLVIVRFDRAVGRFGTIVLPLGLLRVDSITPTVLTARVVQQFGDAKLGDLVIALGELPDIGVGQGEPVQTGPEGQLLQFLVPEPLHGTTDIGFISLGANAGVGIGDEFSVYLPAREIDNERPERLPPTEVATVRVIKVGETASTVRVISVSNAGLRAGLPVRLIRKMP